MDFAYEPMSLCLPVFKDWSRFCLMFFPLWAFFSHFLPPTASRFWHKVQAEIFCVRQAPFFKQDFVSNTARQQIPVCFFRNSGFPHIPWIQKIDCVGEQHFVFGTSKIFELLSQPHTASESFVDFIFLDVIISFEPGSSSTQPVQRISKCPPGKKAAGDRLFSSK